MDATTTRDDLVLDLLPDAVLATMEVRDHWFAVAAPADADGREYFLSDLLSWPVASMLRVAFLGGDAALHRDIEMASRQLTDAGNITLDFGFNPGTGTYRTWSTSDTSYQADIRVSFDQPGFSSLIGRDSITAAIGGADTPMGGAPHQRSLNLHGFPLQRPANWMGVVRHEFLHAIAFFHEHQNPAGECTQQFRWEDDPGYLPTTDARGQYIPDAAGLRPGIYTFLAGAPNHWPREKVDRNLRPLPGQGTVVGPFDQASVMLYRFPALFYATNPSPCAPTGNGIDLSPGDVAGLARLYPFDPAGVTTHNSRRTGVVGALSGFKDGFKDGLPNSLDASLRTLARRELEPLG
jgi:hypothetical protein